MTGVQTCALPILNITYSPSIAAFHRAYSNVFWPSAAWAIVVHSELSLSRRHTLEEDPVVPAATSRDYASRHANVRMREFTSGHELTDVLEPIWAETSAFLEIV